MNTGTLVSPYSARPPVTTPTRSLVWSLPGKPLSGELQRQVVLTFPTDITPEQVLEFGEVFDIWRKQFSRGAVVDQ